MGALVMRFRGPPLLLLLAAGAAGCASVTFVPTNPPPHPLVSRTPERVEVFSSGPPSRPHADIGIITVDDHDPGFSLIRAEAASRGCDAVVVGYRGQYAWPYATCVVYSDGR
jgi:hypothetical protein